MVGNWISRRRWWNKGSCRQGKRYRLGHLLEEWKLMEDALLLLLNEELCEMQIGQGKLDKAILRVCSLSWEIRSYVGDRGKNRDERDKSWSWSRSGWPDSQSL